MDCQKCDNGIVRIETMPGILETARCDCETEQHWIERREMKRQQRHQMIADYEKAKAGA